MFADDSRIEITDPIMEESPPTSDSTLVRHYAFEATLIESPHDAKPFRLPLRWTFEKAEAGDAARPILMGVEVVPYLRVVPDPIVIDATANQVATIERQCLLFFNNDARQTIAFPEQFPSGVTAIMAPDQSNLPENASRLLLRIEPQSLQRSTHSDSMSDLSIPVTVTNGKNQNGVIKIRLVRR